MANVGEVRYKAEIDNSGVEAEIKKTESKLGGFSKVTNKIGSAFQSLGSVGIKALKGIGTAFVGMASAAGVGIAAVSKMGIEYNTQMQSYQTAFSTMLGDAEKAQGLTNNLKNMAAKTPLAMTDLADASQTLLAFGISSEKLIPTLKNLGDVALGDSQKMQSLALAFGQMSSTGKLTGQDLLQMINAGFNPLNEISKMTGKSVADLKEEMSDGAITADLVAEAFQHATSEGGQFYNAMENQSKTFQGQMSTLKDNVSALAGSITSDLFNSLAQDALPKVNGWVDTLLTATEERGVEGAIDAAGSILSEALTELISAAPQFVETATNLLSSFLGAIKENLPQVSEGAINVIMTLLSGFTDMLPDLIDTAGTLISNLINGLANHYPEIAQTGIKLVVNLIQGIGKALPDIIQAVGNLAASIVDTILHIDWIQVGKDIIWGLINGIGAMGGALWDAAKNIARSALDAIKGFFGISSPSKVMRDQVGKQLTAGIAVGIDDGEDEAIESALNASYEIARSFALDVNYNTPNLGNISKDLTTSITGRYSAGTTIEVPVVIDGREVARASAWYMGEQLAWEER